MSKFNFGKKADAFDELKKNAAVEIMTRTKQYFGDAFEKEGLGNEKWPEVSRRTPGSPFNKRQVTGGRNKPTGKTFVTDQGPDFASRKILSGTTGKLKHKTVKANSSITAKGQTSTMINPLPYAEAAFQGNEYQTARPNMEQTPELTQIQLNILQNETGKIWKQA